MTPSPRGAYIRPATLRDARRLAERLRPCDRREIAATSGFSPLKALLTGARLSDQFDAWVIDGRVEALSGAREIARGEAVPWLVGSTAVFGSARRPFARLSRPYAEGLNARWPLLRGQVHAANAAHLRWLEWCGFQLHPPAPGGVSGDLFHPFTRGA